MQYIVIDNFNGDINLFKTEEGQVMLFDSAKEAYKYADSEAQNGQVVPLNTNILHILSNFDDVEGVDEVIGDYNS